MNKQTQREKLIKEEQSLTELIASYQEEIDDYNIDLDMLKAIKRT